MAINLNPKADGALINAAYRSAAGNAPADYSKTLQRAADSYDKTMEAQGEAWGNFAKLGAKIGGEMMANAEKLSKAAAAGAGLNPDDADMFTKEIYGIKDEINDLGIFNGKLGNRETRIKRQELLLKQKELFAEIDAAALTIQNGTQAVAAGLYDANLNEPEAEMVNAIIKSGLKDNVTEEGNIAKLTRDETTGELIYTLYRQNGEKAVLNGKPQTMTLDQFTKSIATNVDDKGLLKANMNKLNDEYAQMGNKSFDGVFDPQMQQLALNKLDNMLKTPTDLKRAMRTQFGYSNTSFYDDIQSPSTLSAGLYSTLLKATGGGEELPLAGVAEGVTDLDGSGGISQAELQNANNYAVLSANILGMKDPEVSKKFFKDYTVRKLEESYNYGFSKKPPKKGSGGGSGGDGSGNYGGFLQYRVKTGGGGAQPVSITAATALQRRGYLDNFNQVDGEHGQYIWNSDLGDNGMYVRQDDGKEMSMFEVARDEGLIKPGESAKNFNPTTKSEQNQNQQRSSQGLATSTMMTTGGDNTVSDSLNSNFDLTGRKEQFLFVPFSLSLQNKKNKDGSYTASPSYLIDLDDNIFNNDVSIIDPRTNPPTVYTDPNTGKPYRFKTGDKFKTSDLDIINKIMQDAGYTKKQQQADDNITYTN